MFAEKIGNVLGALSLILFIGSLIAFGMFLPYPSDNVGTWIASAIIALTVLSLICAGISGKEEAGAETPAIMGLMAAILYLFLR